MSAQEADVYASQRQGWLDKAIASTPVLKTEKVHPVGLVKAVADTSAYQGWRVDPAAKSALIWARRSKMKRTSR